jgi:hypothetical protein
LFAAHQEIIRRNRYDLRVYPEMVGAQGFHRRGDFGAHRGLSPRIIVCTVGLSLAFGAVEARAAKAAPAVAIGQTAPNLGAAIRDLGVLPPPSDADNPTQTSPSAATVSSAQPVPELPVWAMLLLFFGGLGLAGLKRGRKDRLSPGID